MSLTGSHIQTALRSVGAGHSLVMTPDRIAAAFNEAIEKYGDGQFDTVNKVAALISSCMMESAYFRTTEEYFKNGRYKPYIGRTFIQITWEYNYLEFGIWCKGKGLLTDEKYFVKNPHRLADLKWAAIGGVWYFSQVLFLGKPLTEYSSDILQVGRAVNLGNPNSKSTPNGQDHREIAYKAVRALGSSIVPKKLESNTIVERQNIMAIGTRVNRSNKADQTFQDDGLWHDLKIDEPKVDPKTKKTSNYYTFHDGASAGIDVTVGIRVRGGQVDLRGVWYQAEPRKENGTSLSVTTPATPSGDSGVQVSVRGTSKKGELVRAQVRVVKGSGPVVVTDVDCDGWVLS